MTFIYMVTKISWASQNMSHCPVDCNSCNDLPYTFSQPNSNGWNIAMLLFLKDIPLSKLNQDLVPESSGLCDCGNSWGLPVFECDCRAFLSHSVSHHKGQWEFVANLLAHHKNFFLLLWDNILLMFCHNLIQVRIESKKEDQNIYILQ